jgi:glucose-6-phosphate dehydrogenase assembly protein OpcA
MVRPEQVLKELSKLWVDLGHEDREGTADGTSGAGVLRACAMTLITILDESEDPSNVGETVAMLMKEHPSRSVLVRLRPTTEEFLESRVFAQCWMPFGQRRQICCEQIEITASMGSLDDIPGLVLPLAVPDLPVILWSRSPRLFETAAFPKIAAMCGKLIVDTGAFAEPAKALATLASHVVQDRLTADLAWSRITRWRETVSQVFENQDCLDALAKYTDASVEYGGAAPRTEVLYLAAWLQDGLSSAASSAKVKLVKADGPAVGGVTLSGSGSCDVTVKIDPSGGVEVKAGKLENRMIFPEATDYLALQEELSITTRDLSFEQALKTAKSCSNE